MLHSGINPLRCFKESKIQSAQIRFLLQKKLSSQEWISEAATLLPAPGCLWTMYLIFTCSLSFKANCSSAPISPSSVDFGERPRLLALTLLSVVSPEGSEWLSALSGKVLLSWESLSSHSASFQNLLGTSERPGPGEQSKSHNPPEHLWSSDLILHCRNIHNSAEMASALSERLVSETDSEW